MTVPIEGLLAKSSPAVGRRRAVAVGHTVNSSVIVVSCGLAVADVPATVKITSLKN